MRSLLPWVVGFGVLMALWPTICQSGEDEPTTCRSAVLLPLPWGDSADSWGMVAAVVAASIPVLLARLGRLRRRRHQTP